MIIEAPHGTGLEFSVGSLVKHHSYIKVVYVDCLKSASVRTIFVRLLRDAMNVRFSNLNYLHVDLHNLLLVVANRMKQDLRKEKLLIVIDHIDILKSSQLNYFVKLLHTRNPACAMVLRSTTDHRLKLSNKGIHLHDDLYANESLQRVVVQANDLDDMKIFIRDIHGIQNEDFVKDLAKKKWGFSKTLIFINRYKAKGGK